MNEQVALQEALLSRLETIRIRYPRFSLRAFAKRAGVSPATLSLILKGKRKISKKLATNLSERLLFDPQERAEIFNKFLTQKNKGSAPSSKYVQLTQDQYRVLSDWRAFALLNLIGTKGFNSESTWIAHRLAVSVQEVTDTISRLKRLEMLKEVDGTLHRVNPKYRTTEDIANLSLRKSHQQTLELALRSLENDNVERRDFTWVTFPLDTRKLAAAKTLIRKFQDDLLDLMDDGAEPDEVYRLAIQLFPLSKPEGTL